MAKSNQLQFSQQHRTGPYSEDADKTERENSFRNWDPPVAAQEMINAGLQYTGEGDNVGCKSCRIVLSGWKEGDDPFFIHERERPDCWFIQQNKNRGTRRFPIVRVIGQSVQEEHEQDMFDFVSSLHPTWPHKWYSDEEFERAIQIYKQRNDDRDDYRAEDIAQIIACEIAGGFLPEDSD